MSEGIETQLIPYANGEANGLAEVLYTSVSKVEADDNNVIGTLKNSEDSGLSLFIKKLDEAFKDEFFALVKQIRSVTNTIALMPEESLKETLKQKALKILNQFLTQNRTRILEVVGIGRNELVNSFEFFFENLNKLDSLSTQELSVLSKMIDRSLSDRIQSKIKEIKLYRTFPKIKEKMDPTVYKTGLYQGHSYKEIIITRIDNCDLSPQEKNDIKKIITTEFGNEDFFEQKFYFDHSTNKKIVTEISVNSYKDIRDSDSYYCAITGTQIM